MTTSHTSTQYDIKRGLTVSLLTFTGLLLSLYIAVYLGHTPRAESREIRIYTTSWCPYCGQLRGFLTRNKIPYQDYNIESSLWGQAGYWLLGGDGVPLIIAGTTPIQGFQLEPLKQTLTALDYSLAANPTPSMTPMQRLLLNPPDTRNRIQLLPQ